MSDYKLFGLDSDPLVVFNNWYHEAKSKEENADAFAFATVDLEGRADVRYLLYKGMKEGGLSFFSHSDSAKGQQLDANCSAAMAFYWHQTGRQVRVRGNVSLLGLDVSREYFKGRDHASKLSSAVSHQSEVISSREEFLERMKKFESENEGDFPAPDRWRAYTMVADEWEFFIYGANRINDRFRYLNQNGKWVIERLQP